MTFKSSKAIVISGKKLLLLLRDNIPGLVDADTWTLPGGLREGNETPLETLRRELEEEIGVCPLQTELLGFIQTPDQQMNSVFVSKISAEEVGLLRLGNEGQKMDFFSIEDLGRIRLGKNTKTYFDKYQEGLIKLVSDETDVDPKLLGLGKVYEK